MKFKNIQNTSYKVLDNGQEKLIWHSRSVAVNCVIVLMHRTKGPFILISKRGPKAADNIGKWNLVAGYLDWNETATEAVYREAWEECGINLIDFINNATIIRNDLQQPWHVKTEPDENKQNVSLRYGIAIDYNEQIQYPLSLENNEIEGEVEETLWMPYNDIDKYDWAFNHDKVIHEYVKMCEQRNIIKWTELSGPIENVSYYDHVMLSTPIGNFTIEWKSWKESPTYDILIGTEYVGSEFDLESAKNRVLAYLKRKTNELNNLIYNV